MDINLMESLFKQHVDESLRNTSNPNIQEICKRNNIEYQKEITSHQVENMLNTKIKELLERKKSLSIRDFLKLRPQLLLKHNIFDEPIYYTDYFSFINAYSSTEVKLPDLNNTIEWQELLIAILDYQMLSKKSYINLSLSTKEKNEGIAALYWIHRGFNIKVSNGKIDILDKEYKKIGDEVERRLTKIGGKNVIEYLLNNTYFEKKFLRYKLIRNHQTMDKPTPSSIPFGYLFNLAIKNFSKPQRNNSEYLIDSLAELLEMTRHYVALLQLQSYNIYVELFLNHDTFIEHVYNNVLYDKIMLHKQFNPRYIPRNIRVMLGGYFTQINGNQIFGLSFEELISIINYLLNHPSQGQSFRKFDIDMVNAAFPSLNKEIIKHVLDIFTHVKDVNKEFRYPNSISDFDKKPLIYSEGHYLLIDRTLCAFSFYDCLCDIFRETIGKVFDSNLGFTLEDYIKSLFHKHGVQVSYGYYNQNEECDIVIESESSVFFLEIKKKPLTRKALAGDGVSLFSDIAKSILNSQIQLGKHEMTLLKNGEIILYANKGKQKNNPINAKIILNGRKIERVSVNANDYGVLNDKNLTQNILKFLTGVDLQSDNPDRNGELADVRKYSAILYDQFKELQELKKGEVQLDLLHTYFDCSFMSLQMLMTRLENINGNEEFANDFIKTKYVMSGVGEPYFEYFNLTK
ncbi:hypothetical protein [Peribacillus simplex]|uniref:hypothetical protein n=1 Tax=Peribacillus simplex TaxID=1478 RepID=UPI003D2A704E